MEWAGEQGSRRHLGPPDAQARAKAGGNDSDKLGRKRHAEDGVGGGGGGGGMCAKCEASEWKFDYYLVLCRKVLWQGKARLRRHLDLGQVDEEAHEEGGRGGEGGAGDDSLYQVKP